MTSERKRMTNRANAKKSTGPKTEIGKMMSSMNALTLGLFARSKTIPGENRADQIEIQLEVLIKFMPKGPIEIVLCERLADTIWRLRRLQQAQTVALRRTEAAIVVNTVRRRIDRPNANEDDVDFTLEHSLNRELAPDPDAYCAPGTPSEVEMKQLEIGPTVIYSKPPPVALTFLKTYTSKDSKAPALEIETQIWAATKQLLRLHAELEAIQERRKSISACAVETKVHYRLK